MLDELPPQQQAGSAASPKAPPKKPHSARSWARRSIASLVIYIVAFSLPFILENASEIADSLPKFARTLTDSAAWYERFTSAGPRDLLPRYTALVALDTKTLPPSLLYNVCDEQRELLARLTDKLDQAQPGMIVFDFVFLAENCDAAQTGKDSPTGHLIQALSLAAGHRKVIIGQEVEKQELPDGEVVLVGKKSIPLPPTIDSGLVVFNADLRKVPLAWDVGNPNSVSMNTLAYEAALSYRSSYPDHGAALAELSDSGLHPYTSFIPEGSFSTIDAMTLLCGIRRTSPGDWRSCANTPLDPAVAGKLQGRIAVVGWSHSDLHHTILGDMPGFVIHANYIEALLDEHYLKPIDFRWQVLMSAVWFLLMDIPFWIFKEETAKPFAFALGIWLSIALLVYYVAVVNLGYYSALLVPSLAALGIRSVYRWHEAKEREEESV